jgi:uncharacterized protein YbaP (TraB family)
MDVTKTGGASMRCLSGYSGASRMRMFLAVGLVAISIASPAWTQATGPATASSAPSSSAEHAPLLQAVSVTGVQPGPGLWKVSKGDHVMWVLGTLSPLPKHMQWRSTEVEDALAHSQQLLELPTAELKVQAGFFSELALLPSVYSARKNPGGQSLQQVLPPEIYANWEAVKPQYFGDDRGIEYWRPILVAMKLYQKALDKAGLTNSSDVVHTVEKLARKHDVTSTPVKFQLVIEHPRDAVEMIKQTSLHDISCFNQTLNTVQNDMGALTQRANAWSTGDIQALRGFALNNRYESCVIAVVNADFAQQLGLHDLPERMKDTWIAAAQSAMAQNAQTFAVLPMNLILSPDGFIAELKAKGYTVQSPDELDH